MDESTFAIEIGSGLPSPASKVKLFRLYPLLLWIVSFIGLRTGFCCRAAITFSQDRSSGAMSAIMFVVTAIIVLSSLSSSFNWVVWRVPNDGASPVWNVLFKFGLFPCE